MNRKQRRAQPKRSRDATPEEIFPDDRHRPVQAEIIDQLNATMRALRDQFPGYELTLFVAERYETAQAQGRLPHFNYISTASRADMVAVLNAFVKKNAHLAPKLDRFEEPSPTDKLQ